MQLRERTACTSVFLAIVTTLLIPGTASAATRIAQQGQKWTLDNGKIEVTVDAQAGTLTVCDKAAGYVYRQPAARPGKVEQACFRNVREAAGPPRGISFEADFPADKSGKAPTTLQVALGLAEDQADVFVAADMPPHDADFGSVPFLDPLILDTPGAAIAVADYCNGHLYPADLNPFPRGRVPAWRLDMPWVGLCDVEKGLGYMVLLETSDDAYVDYRKVSLAGREAVAPQIVWAGSKGRFAYPRKAIYHFTSSGGYVALAKRYRMYAAEHGLLVTFTEKLKRNPNIQRLFGAPDVWGAADWRGAGAKFAEEAKAAGVEKMLLQGRFPAEQMKAINSLGYLTSEYDCYHDIFPLEPGKPVDAHHDRVPENVVLKADGQRMTAWLTWDKKQYMKRCPAVFVQAAKEVIPKALAEYPFLGRFIDVTTAEELYECYDPQHPLTRGEKRQCGVDLLSYVRSLGLVVGGEHGLWWAVPQLDYIEGMMSSNPHFSWPAGWLKHPKSKDEEFTNPHGKKSGTWEGYERFGIGHQYRAPLWELVFHDCIISTWYWGDASDWLLDAAPEITPKKDAFNVLYGTMPLMWANKEGSWQKARDVFLRTYRNTCKLHEVIATAELLSHEFVTPDRAVQRTRFSDGTEAIVNFGPQPYEAELAGKKYLLPQNGFAVKGPQIEQSRSLVGGRETTVIRTGGYSFSE